MNEDNTIILVGPPGTGKTHRLVDCVELQLNKGVLPRKIAYLAFTKKAADEAVTRVRKKFRLRRDDLPNFRTIHSFAFKALSIQREQVVGDQQFATFGRQYGLEMTGEYDFQEDDFEGKRTGYHRGDRIMFIENLSRVTYRSVAEIMSDLELDHDVTSLEIEAVGRVFREWKQVNNLLDYTDMLEQYIERGHVPDLDVVIVDEAQDLSPIQWKVVEKIAAGARLVYIAGDDDQAIYRWAGADVNRFIDLPGRSRVLDQSYRVPSSVQPYANRIVGRIRHRRSKTWNPRAEVGNVQSIGSFPAIEREISAGGHWLILSRNRKFLKHYRHLSEPGRVTLSTIHRVKGGEADNVVLITDITPRVFNWMQTPIGLEDECRVFYVAATRAKKNLFIMEPQGTRYFQL